MTTIDLDEIDDGCIPEGRYLCELVDIGTRETQHGDPMWSIRFQVVDGPQRGACFYDNLVWARRSLIRGKLLCEAIKLGPKVELDTTLFVGKRLLVDVYIDDNPEWGRRNKVPFRGYWSAGPDAGPGAAGGNLARGPETPRDDGGQPLDPNQVPWT